MERLTCAPVTRLHSKGAVQVIVWTYLVFAATCTIFAHPTTPSYRVAESCAVGVAAILGPFAGLISSICFGRYRSLSSSLWLMWSANVCIVAFLVFREFVADSYQLVLNVGLFLSFMVLSTGFVVVLVNLVPFGVDQMPDASAEQSKAFVSRFAWSALAGGATANLIDDMQTCGHLPLVESITLQSLFSAVCLSMLLCSNFLCNRWLTVEPEDTNPLKHMYRVLLFAAKHKYPVRRSAFTYCENEQPSRIDLSKVKYGGPFTCEEVENVKTFFRMSLVIILTLIILTPGISLLFSTHLAFHGNFFPSDSSYCHYHLVRSGCFLFLLSTAVSPPVFELIQRKLRKCISRTLHCVTLAQTLTTLVALILLVMSSVWYMKHSSAEWPFYGKEFDVHYYWMEIPVNFLLFSWMYVTLVGLLEFVCAQAPYRQRGLLMGLMFSMLFISGGCAALFVYSYLAKAHNSASNGVWFCLVLTSVTILGSLIWSCVAKRYKNRERDEPDRVRVYVEEVYDRYCRLQTP